MKAADMSSTAKSLAASRSYEWDLTNLHRGSRPGMAKKLKKGKKQALKQPDKAIRKKKPKDAISAGCNS